MRQWPHAHHDQLEATSCSIHFSVPVAFCLHFFGLSCISHVAKHVELSVFPPPCLPSPAFSAVSVWLSRMSLVQLSSRSLPCECLP